MTRAEIMQLARFLLDEHSADWLLDSSSSYYDLGQAVFAAYEQYAMETKCFVESISDDSVEDQAEYSLATMDSSVGPRIFEVRYVGFDSKELAHTDINQLSRVNPHWRYDDSGTPRDWMMWGDGSIRVHPAPDSVATLDVEGYVTPATTAFDDAADVPAIHSADHELIAIGAAIIVATRDPSNENVVRASPLFDRLRAGYARARRRIHRSGSVVVGSGGTGVRAPQTILGRITPAI